jgi:phosphonate degradation associated HDIG domain protein
MKNINPENMAADDTVIELDTVLDWLRHRANGLYGGEAVTQLEHALQCAALAQAAGAAPALVTAALLHDIGHLADSGGDEKSPHGKLAARLLGGLFGRNVTEPIRLHVDAKRYLCATDPSYWASLSDASKRSMEWQGGLFSRDAAETFIELPYANDAIRLRRWDDAAKVLGAPAPALETFVPVMQAVMHSTSVATAKSA